MCWESVARFVVIQAGEPRSAAHHADHGPRWVVALALGLRQGEALGLQWNDLDDAKGLLWVRRIGPSRQLNSGMEPTGHFGSEPTGRFGQVASDCRASPAQDISPTAL